MYQRLLFSMLLMIAAGGALMAQSNDLIYQSEIQAAQSDLKDEQFRSALRHLEKAKAAKGQTTASIQSLSVKSYLGLKYYDDARTALKSYFEIAKEGDDGFQDMLLLLSKIDDIEAEEGKKEEVTKTQKADEEKEWQKTVALNTNEAYLDFFYRYPGNENAIKAKANIKNNLSKKLDEEMALANKYLSKKKGRKAAKNLLFWPGLLLGTYGALKMGDVFDFDDRCYNEEYNSTYGYYYCSNYDDGSTDGIVYAAVGSAMMFTSFFIRPNKYKRLYKKQMIKVEQTRKEVQLYSWIPPVAPSNGWTSTGFGLGLSIKF